jgi:hypothetical protein
VKQLISYSEAVHEARPCRETLCRYTTPLIDGARLGRRATVLELLNTGANINSRDTYGASALIAALCEGYVEIAIDLLENQADPNLTTCIGHGSCASALRCARRFKNSKLVKKIESPGGIEQPGFLSPFECIWLDIKPMFLLVLTRVALIVFVVVLSYSVIRRYSHR